MFKLTYLYYIFFILILAHPVNATPNKASWLTWQVHNPLSHETISHDAWQKFLNKHLICNNEGIHEIDYRHITQKDKALLKDYLHQLQSVPIHQYNRKEQLAYWINLYNALVVDVVANYPFVIDTIEDIHISPGLFSVGPWHAKLININGINLSLDDIQNQIIRPIWNDPRVHYALNNGSIGAPNLSQKAYNGLTLDDSLNQAAYAYINSFRGVQVIEGQLIVSKIYEWFNEDFGGKKETVIAHLKQFAKEPLKSQLNHINTIENYVYNWHLNSTPKNS